MKTTIERLECEKKALETKLANAERIVTEIRGELYQQGYEVAGWHLSGELADLDSWFEDNEWELK